MKSEAVILAAATVLSCGGPQALPVTDLEPQASTPASSEAPLDAGTPNPSPTATTTTSTGTADDAGPDAAPNPVAESSEWLDKCQQNGKEFEKKVHADLKQCHADGSKKGYLKGSIKLAFKIDWDGKKKEIRTGEKSDLPKGVVDCMLKVVKDAQFGDPEACKGKDLTIVLKFPPTR
jgi:hypothetical protein